MAYYVYIDDSGDQGMRINSSVRLIAAAVVIKNTGEKDRINVGVNSFKEDLGWRAEHELKFNTANKDVIRDFIKVMGSYDFDIYAVVMDKTKLSAPQKRRLPKRLTFIYLVAGSIARSYADTPDANDYITLFGKKVRKIYEL